MWCQRKFKIKDLNTYSFKENGKTEFNISEAKAITNLLKELASEGIIPIDYDYSKIREILIEKDLITIDSIRQTVATDYALENCFYFIASVSNKKEEPTYGYYVSEKLRELLIDVFSSYKNIDELRRIS